MLKQTRLGGCPDFPDDDADCLDVVPLAAFGALVFSK